ncbi:MAG TPA: sulfite exporter TauE/SafE family protein [Vicinamibacterales bacterium]
MTMTAAAVALAIGAAMGLFGGGGSLLLVPALTYLMGFDAKQAVTTSLAVVGISAAVGSAARLAHGTLPIKPALVIGIATVLGALAGSAIGTRLDDHLQMRIFGVIVVVAAVALGWRSASSHDAAKPARGRAVLAAAGLGVGFVTGLIGVGGGFLIVPALVIGANLDIRDATSVSLFVMVLATASAFAGYAATVTPDWWFVLPFAAIASAGTVAGGIAAQSVSQQLLQRVFAAGLIVVAAFILIRG